MIREKKRASLMKRRIVASLIGLCAVIALLIAMGVIKELVNITPWSDADGTEYYIRRVNEQYGLYDANKTELPKENAYQYYETPLGTLVQVDAESGELGEVIYVENIFSAQGNEVEDVRHRVQIFPHIKKKDILSIDVKNEHGSFTFQRFNTTTNKVDSASDFVIKGSVTTTYDQEKFAELYVDAGYALSTMKLKDPIKDAAGEFTEYGLVPQTRTRDQIDKNGEAVVDENGKPVTEEYLYVPATYIITDVSGNRHKIIVGDELLTGDGYYVQYVDISGSQEVKRDAVYVLDSTLGETVLAPVEHFVTPMITYPLGMMTYTNVQNFTVRELEQKAVGKETSVYRPIIAFSFVDISHRENTLASSFPYYFDDVSFMEEILSMKGYFPHTDNINACLENLYKPEFLGVKKLLPTDADLEKYGIYTKLLDESGNPILDEKGNEQYAPASKYTLSFDYTVEDDELEGVYYIHSHVIMISDVNEDGNRYAYSIINTTGYKQKDDGSEEKLNGYTYSYNSIVEVAGHSMNFLEWGTMDWVSKAFIQSNIAFIDEIKMETNDYQAIFDLDNSASPTDTASSADLKIHATDSLGKDITTFNKLVAVDEYDYVWTITANAIQVVDSNGKTAKIKDGISYYDHNVLGMQVLCRNGYLSCKNGDKIEVTANNIKVIHPNGKEENYVRYSTELFRLLYQTMFYAEIVNTYEVSDEEEAALTDPSNLILRTTITTKDRDGTIDTNEYSFYRISSRKAYITINGNGGFYVQSGRIEKFLSDAEKFFNYQVIVPTAKN